ncbi:YbaK/prolyl-tRNA synthetase associated domain-containing protein [Candidatus Woesearchaeota archaeon]|nr:YbaK/prolyl-tRNA synthetase associated domain-containing protein [Candidatus Woesearchaeota archaeon]
MSLETRQQIIALLNEKNISFKHQQHKTIKKTAIQAANIRGSELGEGAKALILKTKSERYIQVILPADKKVDLKVIKKIVGEKNISLASPNEVLTLTDCVLGSVPPFGVLWNIKVIGDNKLLEKKEVVFSAGTLQDSIYIKPKELLKCNKARVENISKEE